MAVAAHCQSHSNHPHRNRGASRQNNLSTVTKITRLQQRGTTKDSFQSPRNLRGVVPHASASASFLSLPSVENTYEVESLRGIRAVADGPSLRIEYLVKWKDDSEDAWEPANNLSEDLAREFEERWWTAARKADFKTLAGMLEGGREVLSQVVNESGQSALHFAAALGREDCVRLLLEAGADGNLQDANGYTPLHMAAGYMHANTMSTLLQAGLGPEIKDNKGKDVVSLIEDLRSKMPLSLSTIMQRLKLEEVSNSLTDLLYDEAEVARVLEQRPSQDGRREFLVQFVDGHDDEWVHERDLAAEVIEDFEQGMENAVAVGIEDMVQIGTYRKFRVRWSDGYPTSWEPEEHVPEAMIEAFKQQQPQLFEERVGAADTARDPVPA